MKIDDVVVGLGIVGMVYGFGAVLDRVFEPYNQVFKGNIDGKQVTYTEDKGSFWKWNKYDEMEIKTKGGKTFRILDYLGDSNMTSSQENSLFEKPDVVQITEKGKTRTFNFGNAELDSGRPGTYPMEEAKERAELRGQTKAVFDQANKIYPEFRQKIKDRLAEMAKETANKSEQTSQSELERQLK